MNRSWFLGIPRGIHNPAYTASVSQQHRLPSVTTHKDYDVTERMNELLHGTDREQAIYNLQRCVVQHNSTEFGGGSPDLGGIGVCFSFSASRRTHWRFLQVLLSLTTLCIASTVGCWVVIALSVLCDYSKSFKSKLKGKGPEWIVNRILLRINDACTTSLSEVLDTVLFLSVTVLIASTMWWFRANTTNDTVSGSNDAGRFLYNGILMVYTMIITICPCLAIIHTPYLWKNVRRRKFRLTVITSTVVMARIIFVDCYKIFHTLSVDIDPKVEDWITWPVINDQLGCSGAFLFDLLSLERESAMLLASWIMCAGALAITIFIQWDENYFNLIKTMRKSSNVFVYISRSILGRESLRASGAAISEADNTESRRPSRTVNPSVSHSEGTGRPGENLNSLSPTADLESQPPIPDVGSRGSNRGSENIASETRNIEAQPSTHKDYSIFNILCQILYGFIYIAIQALPVYYLWRIRWIRAHFRAMMQPPHVPGSVYPPSEDLENVLTIESKDWDSDEWSFRQILTLSLWCPALLEILYIMICMQICFFVPIERPCWCSRQPDQKRDSRANCLFRGKH